MTGLRGLVALAIVALACCGAASEIKWETRPWGEIGTATLTNAPFPDDSRTTGFTNRRGQSFPREGHYDDPTVAFCIPKGFQPAESPDLIVHFHGHNNTATSCIVQFRLGEQLEASGRNAVLIVPQGPRMAPDSGGGKLEKAGGFAAFVEEAIQCLVAAGRLPAGARPRHIVLSAHSGGYRVTGMIIDRGGLTDRIREVWLFDAAYAQWDELARPFALPDSGRRLRSIFTDHLASANLQIMSRLTLRGAPVAVIRDDHLSTAGVSADAFASFAFHSEEARAGEEELPLLLRRHPNLFMYTTLSHNDLVMEARYFELFARESPFLGPR
jgi:hypothetical protein